METSPFAFILYGIFAFFALIAIGLSYLIYRLIRTKNQNKWWQLFALIPIIAFAFLMYRVYVPGDSFYEGHFTSVTGLEFPAYGEILYGETSAVDEFGDGTYTSISNLGGAVLEKIPAHLVEQGYVELEAPNQYTFEKYFSKVIREFSFQEIGKYVTVGFLADGESLFIRISFW
jgi:hypothetical protein